MWKRLEFLKNLIPSISRAGVLMVRGDQSNVSLMSGMQEPADALRLGAATDRGAAILASSMAP